MPADEKLVYGGRAQQDQARFVVEKGMWIGSKSKK
jgi:hypothetical protein